MGSAGGETCANVKARSPHPRVPHRPSRRVEPEQTVPFFAPQAEQANCSTAIASSACVVALRRSASGRDYRTGLARASGTALRSAADWDLVAFRVAVLGEAL